MSDCIIAAIASNPECARAAKRAGADIVYVSALNYGRGCAQKAGCLVQGVSSAGYPKRSVIQIPGISHDAPSASEAGAHQQVEGYFSREDALGVDVWEHVFPGSEVYVESLGGLFRAAQMECASHVGPAFGVLNAETLSLVSGFGARLVWLSAELNISQVAGLCRRAKKDGNVVLGVKVAGAQELMVMEHCILMSEGECLQECSSCRRRMKCRALEDRKGYSFPVSTDALGRSHVYNSVQLDVAHDIPELMSAGIRAFCVDSTLMDEEQTAQAVGRCAKAIELASSGESLPKQPNTTSGHLHRGIR